MSSIPFACILISFLGGNIFGYSCIGINGALTKLYSCAFGLIPERSHTLKLAMLISAINFGGLLGSILVTRAPRKIHPCVLLFTGTCLTICSLLGIFTHSFSLHFVCRLLSGIGVGIISIICPSYVVKTSPLRYRGALGGLFQVSIAFGIAISAVISYFLMADGRDLRIDDFHHLIESKRQESMSVFGMFGLSLIYPCVCAVLLGLIALKQSISRKTGGELSRSFDTELSAKKSTKNAPFHGSSSDIHELSFTLRLKRAHKAVIISIMAAVALQLTGINAVMYYTFAFLEAAGIKRQALGTIFIMAINFSATLIPLGIADRVGRRPLIIAGLLFMTLSMLILCFTSNLIVSSSSKVKSIVGFSVLSLYLYGFGLGPGFHFWLICNEVLPSYFYQEGFALANTTQWLFLILVTSLFPFMQSHLGSYVFLIFSSIGAISTLFFYFLLPETRGLSKETIEKLLRNAKAN